MRPGNDLGGCDWWRTELIFIPRQPDIRIQASQFPAGPEPADTSLFPGFPSTLPLTPQSTPCFTPLTGSLKFEASQAPHSFSFFVFIASWQMLLRLPGAFDPSPPLPSAELTLWHEARISALWKLLNQGLFLLLHFPCSPCVSMLLCASAPALLRQDLITSSWTLKVGEYLENRVYQIS